MNIESTAMKPNRGRKTGSATRTLAKHKDLGSHHFRFLGGLVEGLDAKSMWDRYMAFSGDGKAGPERYAVDHMLEAVRSLAAARGLSAAAEIALGGIGRGADRI